MTSMRSRWIVAGAALAALLTFKGRHFQYENEATAASACTTDLDCVTECRNTVSNFAFKCISASQFGYGFQNRCAWLTVSSKVTPPGANGATTLYNDTTRTGIAYQACSQ